jgi:peptide/nickel transport system substrate-binding protein
MVAAPGIETGVTPFKGPMRTRLIGFLACVVLVAASCQSATPSSAPTDESAPGASADASAAPDSNLAAEQILRVVIPIEPGTLDPTLVAGAVELSVLRALHRGLVSLDQDLNVVPELAESWDISDEPGH